MKTSDSDNGLYPQVCENAVNDNYFFENFKTNRDYNTILEHVSYDDGIRYLEIIKNKYPQLISKFSEYQKNDSVGNPKTFDFENFGKFSPTTLRYVKVLGDLIEKFGNLDGMNIVEVGGGYGGQCKIILDTFKIQTYTIFDLPQVIKLQKKYLDRFNYPQNSIFFKTLDEELSFTKIDLFISNYAYTECIKEIRDMYFDKLISFSSNGYMIANQLSQKILEEEILNKIKNSKQYKEEPETCESNSLIVWTK